MQKVTLQIGQKKLLRFKKLKILCRGHMLLVILMEKKWLEHYTKKNCKKQIQKTKTKFRIKKVINRKGGKSYAEWKRYSNSFNSWIDKKDGINE